jgi:hypothetical protein
MEYSHLQRDFKEKDVQRLRNLITEKYGEKTVTQVGAQKVEIDHREGDIWEESGKTWTIKNGLKQTYTKLDDLKKTLRMPLACPHCKKAMKHYLDEKFYNMHSKCFGCVVEMETLMRHNGTYNQYAEEIVANNMISFIDEAAEFINDYAVHSDDHFYSENGEKEIFIGGGLKSDKVEIWKKELAELKSKLSEHKKTKTIEE